MADIVRDFYDEFAEVYHFMFENWEASMARQAAVLAPILERECGPANSIKVLDSACGIGTQALGLAKLGFCVTGADISSGAIERARREALARNLAPAFYVADMRQLSVLPKGEFDAVICMDNALPHLSSNEELAEALVQARTMLRSGGTFVASIRDYDRYIAKRPSAQGPGIFSDDGRRRIVFQLWDWLDERRYTFHVYITREAPSGWVVHHAVSSYRAVLRDELTKMLASAGFQRIRWMQQRESGFHQPLVVATAAT